MNKCVNSGSPRAKTSAQHKAHRRIRDTPTTCIGDFSQVAAGLVVLVLDDALTKNEHHRIVKLGDHARLRHSDVAQQLREAMRACAEAHGVTGGLIDRGAWRLDVLTIWPTRRHLDFETANGDSDATLSPTKDALQYAGILDNDMRVIADRTWSAYAKGRRRTIVRLTRIDFDTWAREVEDMAFAGERLTKIHKPL